MAHAGTRPSGRRR